MYVSTVHKYVHTYIHTYVQYISMYIRTVHTYRFMHVKMAHNMYNSIHRIMLRHHTIFAHVHVTFTYIFAQLSFYRMYVRTCTLLMTPGAKHITKCTYVRMHERMHIRTYIYVRTYLHVQYSPCSPIGVWKLISSSFLNNKL